MADTTVDVAAEPIADRTNGSEYQSHEGAPAKCYGLLRSAQLPSGDTR
jgi:hypothetical protein